jgi:hypothetical protein
MCADPVANETCGPEGPTGLPRMSISQGGRFSL